MLNSHLTILIETLMMKTIETKSSHILQSETESVHSEWPPLLEPCTSLPGTSHIFEPMLSSRMAQMVKCLPTMGETWVQSLGQEDPLEKAIATHSSILAWRIPWTEERGRLQSTGSQRVRHNWATNTLVRKSPHFAETSHYSTSAEYKGNSSKTVS